MGVHDGHRQRLMKKLDSNTLLPHEELEMLLFYVLPRRDTNGLAHALLESFGSLRAVFDASVEQLCRVDGIGLQAASFLSLMGKVARRIGELPTCTYEGRFENLRFITFARTEYANEKHEVADVYLLKKGGEILRRQRFSGERIFSVEVLPSEMAQLLVDEQAAGIVLVHNHPCGNAVPSQADDDATRRCQLLCSCHNVLFCDHLICASDGVYSYYLSGRLKKISETFSLSGVIKINEGEGQV